MSFEKSKRVKFWKSKELSLEIKRDEFWKSKVTFEKSNATNLGNQKCYLRNQTRQILEIKRGKLWKSKLLLEKSKATNLKSK